MTDSRVLRHGAWSTLAWVFIAVAPVVYLWAAATTLSGALSGPTGMAVGGGTGAVLMAVLLVRLALLLPHGPCRGAGLLGMGCLAAGLGPVVAAAVPAGWSARAVAVSLTCSAALFLFGLLLLPGTAADWRARVRRVLDGVGAGVSLFFAAWLLAIVPLAGTGRGPAGPRVELALGVWLVTSVALAGTALTAIRAHRYRRSALLCGGGVALTLSADAVLVVLWLIHAPVPVLFVALAGVAAGPLLVALGAYRAGVRTDPPHPSVEAGTFAGLPLLAVPVALVVLGAVYHLATMGGFGTYSAALGVLVMVAVGVRELFAVFDVRRYAAELAEQEARFRSIVSGSTDVTVLLDENLVVSWQSPAAARQLGLSDADVIGRPFSALFHPEDAPALAEELRGLLIDPPERPVLVQGRIRDGFGGWRYTESTATDHSAEPSVAGLVVHLRDVGDRRRMERDLRRVAFTDPLTGLPNRRALLRALAEVRDRTGEHAWRGSVVVLDLDGLKEVNDGRGHDVGDAILIEVGRRMRESARSDFVARLGGAEFAVLAAGSQVSATGLAARLLAAVGEPFEQAGGRMFLTTLVVVPEYSPCAAPDELLSGADLAMRRARRLGRNRVERYDESLEFQLLRRELLETELRGADRRGELDLVYQPIVTVTDRRPIAVEALLRWRHPQLGTVGPAEFVPIAEETGLIADVGTWTLHQACRRLRLWRADGRDIQVAVNLAAAQLHAPDLLAEIASVLDTHDVPADRLVVEVTENAVMADLARAVGQLGGLRELGVRTALDDFGTGNAALTCLRRLPLNALKANQTIVGGPGTPAAPLADVVVRLGERLGLRVVAEGVETEEQLDVLREAGCRYAQGYLFSRPVPAEHAEAFLEAHPDAADAPP